MNRSTTASTSDSTEPQIAPPVETRWMTVVFLQGEEADAVLEMIEKAGHDIALHHLSHWDYGDETRDAALANGYVYDEIPQSSTDRVIHDHGSGYTLTYNRLFGYVSLLRQFDPIIETARKDVAPPAWSASARPQSVRRTPGLRL
jgi:hypothetical protein